MKYILLLFGIFLVLFLARQTYWAWFNPKKSIESFRYWRNKQLNLFPFLRKFSSYPDEDYVLMSNKIASPIMLIISLIWLLALVFQTFQAT